MRLNLHLLFAPARSELGGDHQLVEEAITMMNIAPSPHATLLRSSAHLHSSTSSVRDGEYAQWENRFGETAHQAALGTQVMYTQVMCMA